MSLAQVAGRPLRVWIAVLAAAVALLGLTGCFLSANREITLLVTRTDTGGSEVTVTYRMPPPKEGQYYVLWIVNADSGQSVRVGTVEPTAKLRAIRTKVGFWATGAVISIESNPDATQMSGDSELESGVVRKDQVTPGAK